VIAAALQCRRSSFSDSEKIEFAHLIEDRHGFDNLLLVCLRHARLVDDPGQSVTVTDLVRIKRAHENATLRSRSREQRRADHILLQYAAIVDEWEERSGLREWDQRYGSLVADGHPRMSREDFEDLRALRMWLFSRVWPREMSDIEEAFENFRRVAQDLQLLLERHQHEHLDKRGIVAPARFYNDERYVYGLGIGHQTAGKWYEWYAALIEDLALELTRAANLICETVRRRIDVTYRLEHGVVTITRGTRRSARTTRRTPLLHRTTDSMRSSLSGQTGTSISDREGNPTASNCRGTDLLDSEASTHARRY
jgi:hypothetical protein